MQIFIASISVFCMSVLRFGQNNADVALRQVANVLYKDGRCRTMSDVELRMETMDSPLIMSDSDTAVPDVTVEGSQRNEAFAMSNDPAGKAR